MPYVICPGKNKKKATSFQKITKPEKNISNNTTLSVAWGTNDSKTVSENQINALSYFLLYKHSSGPHPVHVVKEDELSSDSIANKEDIKKHCFFEVINRRGLEQLLAATNLVVNNPLCSRKGIAI
ncbi:MAG: hypothetical protein ABH871_07945 [Pseudomonadota bacterium]